MLHLRTAGVSGVCARVAFVGGMTGEQLSERWSAEQVAALAPDAAALAAGRTQAVPTRWTSLGASGSPSAIWGLCSGSGSKPYQTIVDRSGPAFRTVSV